MTFYCDILSRVQGGTRSIDLMATNVSVIPREICNPAYGGILGQHVICAGSPEGGKDTCQVLLIDKLIH